MDNGDKADQPPPTIERVASVFAVIGGTLALGVALLVTVSVLGRWLFSKPVEGDFEFVKMATALGIFAYMPYTQARRGNIMVDTFTMKLPGNITRTMDAFWDIIFACAMTFCAYGLFVGTRDAMKTGETTMQLQIIMWPVIGASALLCAVTAVTAVLTGIRLLGSRS
jgi:TRAP-type C4-dicarboxylate transport system permease small subunit